MSLVKQEKLLIIDSQVKLAIGAVINTSMLPQLFRLLEKDCTCYHKVKSVLKLPCVNKNLCYIEAVGNQI